MGLDPSKYTLTVKNPHVEVCNNCEADWVTIPEELQEMVRLMIAGKDTLAERDKTIAEMRFQILALCREALDECYEVSEMPNGFPDSDEGTLSMVLTWAKTFDGYPQPDPNSTEDEDTDCSACGGAGFSLISGPDGPLYPACEWCDGAGAAS